MPNWDLVLLATCSESITVSHLCYMTCHMTETVCLVYPALKCTCIAIWIWFTVALCQATILLISTATKTNEQNMQKIKKQNQIKGRAEGNFNIVKSSGWRARMQSNEREIFGSFWWKVFLALLSIIKHLRHGQSHPQPYEGHTPSP